MSGRFDPFDYTAFWKPFRRQTTRFQEVFPEHCQYPELIRSTEALAYLIRSYSVYSMTCAALGHPGGSLSEAEILAVMFDYVLRYDPRNFRWPARDGRRSL